MSLNDLEFTVDFGGVSFVIEIKAAGIPILFDDPAPVAVIAECKAWLNAKIGTAIETRVKQILIAQWIVDNVTTTP